MQREKPDGKSGKGSAVIGRSILNQRGITGFRQTFHFVLSQFSMTRLMQTIGF